MPIDRPKLLVLDGPFVPGAELAQVLGDRYDVAVAPGPSAGANLAGGAFQVVFGGTGQLSGGDGELSEHDATAMLSAIGEGLCLVGADGRVVWSNDRFRALDEQTRARIVVVCRRAAQRFVETGVDGSTGGMQTVRLDVSSPDESRHFEVVASPVPSVVGGGAAEPVDAETATEEPAERDAEAVVGAGGKETTRVAAVIWDVTATRRRQQKMAAIDRAGFELVRLDAEQIRKMHVGERLKVLEEKIVRYSHDLLHFDHLAIRLQDERTGKLELVIATGLAPEAMEVELVASSEGNGIMGHVAATGQSYVCGDVTKDPRYVVGIHDARSSLTVPLRLSDKVIGAFNVESERLDAFGEEDLRFAEMFANHIALALHILDLLVVERCTTGANVTDTVEDELSEPLSDILKEADLLKTCAGADPQLREHVERIMSDVDAIRRRVREAAEGPQHILGAEKAIADQNIDPTFAGKRVLVADDELRIRQTIREVLRGRGCVVTVCENGSKAIEELERAAAARNSPYSAPGSGSFDVLISDIRMPDKNGYEVFSAARRLCPGIPTILMTGFGYDPHHSIVRASQEGLQCVLFKPFEVERLLEEVRKAIGAGVGGS